jgi:hypothetical protein
MSKCEKANHAISPYLIKYYLHPSFLLPLFFCHFILCWHFFLKGEKVKLKWLYFASQELSLWRCINYFIYQECIEHIPKTNALCCSSIKQSTCLPRCHVFNVPFVWKALPWLSTWITHHFCYVFAEVSSS